MRIATNPESPTAWTTNMTRSAITNEGGMAGVAVGFDDGRGDVVGDGDFDGDLEGDFDFDGDAEGDLDGDFDGDLEGAFDGDSEGAFVGTLLLFLFPCNGIGAVIAVAEVVESKRADSLPFTSSAIFFHTNVSWSCVRMSNRLDGDDASRTGVTSVGLALALWRVDVCLANVVIDIPMVVIVIAIVITNHVLITKKLFRLLVAFVFMFVFFLPCFTS